ncbi:MAG: TonB family protein [Candidatus Omnitrophica bacterium]|nr:TonB family protein [Candidatus Omnitrophota bacterium]
MEYIGLIQQQINACFVYPQAARLKGWEGIAKVKFTFTRDGRIKAIDIAESSGYPLLDAAAILAVRDASPYPFPEDYPEEELEITLPLNYHKPTPKKNNPTPPVPEEPKQRPLPYPQELSSFINLAIENNQPAKIAVEEVKLAQIKVTEARRNLFPGVKLSGYNTQGDVHKIDYEEQEAKIEVTQPLFYGGKLTDTIRQAKVNLEITKRNSDRLKLDVRQKTEIAYYNLVAAKMHLKLKETFIEEGQEMLKKIESLFAAGMAIPLEVTSARAWFENMQLQVDAIKQDLSIAELTLRQVLNTKTTPEVRAQGLPETKELNNIDLSTCKEAALQHRPELYLSELLVKFNDYGQKIRQSESNAVTVDLTSSYGYYQGHYETEPWDQSRNWFAGVKVSKPWGGSTINTSYSKETTEPRFGQTSPTGSSTISAEFSLLDNLKRLSDKKVSDIEMQRVLSDFDETLKTITFEVQDAFLNYQKIVLQLNAAQTEMKFRRNQTEVTKIRALVGETTLSSAMEAIFTFSEAQTKYIQALANYYISLANLKKATGYGIQI